jgi:hypothetical protein
MTEPFLDFGDVSAGVQGVSSCGGAGGMGTEAIDTDANLLAIEFDQLIDAVGSQSGVESAAIAVVADGAE